MSILRLDPPMPVETPKGKALAFIWENPGFEHHNLWHTMIEETGEFWTFQNPEVRAQRNYTSHIRQAFRAAEA